MGFTQHLRSRGEDDLAALLAVRPDLASPPPSSVRALSARAAGRASLERALADLDALTLQVLDAVVTLAGTAHHPEGPTTADVAAALGTSATALSDAVRTLLARALVWTPTWPPAAASALVPSPGLDEVLGPYPAGLGPTLATTLGRRTPQALERLATDTAAPSPEPEVLARHLADPTTVTSLLAAAPPAARRVLDALTWGPPVGQAPAPGPPGIPSPARDAVQWLLRHGLLAMSDAQHAVLPRDVALVLRGGRVHAEPALPPRPLRRRPDPSAVDGDSARHAEEMVRLVGALLAAWGEQPVQQVRAGGLGVRELRRLAGRLDVPDDVAALVVEVAGAAGLVAADDGERPTLAPTTDADDWLTQPLPARWERLAVAWWHSDRASWLVGSRDEGGSTRTALDPELRRPWLPRQRAAVLEVLRDTSEPGGPTALTADDVADLLRWRTPRTPPTPHTVEAVLNEATLLGVVGAGALSAAGDALVAGGDPAGALEGQLPPAVGEVLLQGDLTGVVPGRPEPALAALLDASAEVESRGAALTVRFTEQSVRRALDTGMGAEELLGHLSQHARGVPQPLEYLVLDVARRHGRLRIGTATSYVRAEDPALLAGLVGDATLVDLGLRALAPTVLAATAPPAALLEALRSRGLAPVVEGPEGQVMLAQVDPHRVRARRGQQPPQPESPEAREARQRRLHRLATDLLAADRRAGGTTDGDEALPPGDPAAPVLALGLLREAAEEHRAVWLEVVGPDGASSRRRVRPLRVAAGRVRLLDLDREAELSVAVHRIVDVTPAAGSST